MSLRMGYSSESFERFSRVVSRGPELGCELIRKANYRFDAHLQNGSKKKGSITTAAGAILEDSSDDLDDHAANTIRPQSFISRINEGPLAITP